MIKRLGRFYGLGAKGLDLLQHPVLLAVRIYWGYSLMIGGWGKLQHIDDIAKWFASLGIPMPEVNAYMAGGTELVGSMLLIVGLASRPAALAIAFTMSVAFMTSDVEVFATLNTDPWCFNGTRLGDCVVLSTPWPYWFAAVLVLVFGPGALSIDKMLGTAWKRRTGGK